MTIAVVGAGLQGVCLALELAGRNLHVDLYDKCPQILTQAGLHNEGKLHLGFVWAKDESGLTANLMVDGALSFVPGLRRWLGSDVEGLARSSTFHYVVHRDSLVGPDDLQSFYDAVTRRIAERAGASVDMLGAEPRNPVMRIGQPTLEEFYDPRAVSAVFQSPEIAINPESLAPRLRARVAADPRITVLTETEVHAMRPGATEVEVDSSGPGGPETRRYAHAVNASWEDMLALDATAGIHAGFEWTFRIKHFLRVDAVTGAARGIPSATIVLGPFGDIVNYGDGNLFLSWYPAGRLGMSSDLRPPAWPRVLDREECDSLRDDTLSGLSAVSSCIRRHAGEQTGTQYRQCGGIIFAAGTKDVHDPTSGLHRRSAIGPRSYGRYHSIDVGKWVMAPMFAIQMADVISPP